MPDSTRGSGKEAGARCGPDKAAAGFLRASPAVERVAAGHHGVTPARPARPFGPLPVQALKRLETGCHLALATIRQTQDNGIGKHDISHDFLLMFWWSFSEQGIRLRLLSQLTSGKRQRRLQAEDR